MKDPQAVFIDWYLTLSRSVFWGHLAAEDRDAYDRLNNALFVTLQSQLFPWMRGAWTSEQVMARVSEAAGLSYDFIWPAFVSSCKNMAFISPEVPGLVAELRGRGVRVVVATDNMDSFTRFTAPAMRLSSLFDDVLNSFDLRAMKDDLDASGRSLFFQDYLLAHGLAPERCVLIDDSLDTLETAPRIGLGYRLVTDEHTLVHHLHELCQETA